MEKNSKFCQLEITTKSTFFENPLCVMNSGPGIGHIKEERIGLEIFPFNFKPVLYNIPPCTGNIRLFQILKEFLGDLRPLLIELKRIQMPGFLDRFRNSTRKRPASSAGLNNNGPRHNVKLKDNGAVVHRVQDLCFTGEVLCNESGFGSKNIERNTRLVEGGNVRPPRLIEHFRMTVSTVGCLILVTRSQLCQFAAFWAFIQYRKVVVFNQLL